MSEQEKKRNYGPSEPSTSKYYRSDPSRLSQSKRTPYARPPESRGHSSLKGVIKTVDPGTKCTDDASTSSICSLQYGCESIKIKTESENEDTTSKKEIRRSSVKETIFVTKPNNLVTKQGTSGRKIILQTNYFKLLTVPDWCLYKYRVDYEPDVSHTIVRKGLLKSHKEKIGSYIFDGTVMYASSRLLDKLQLLSKQSDNTEIKINIRLVGNMVRDDPHYIQFFNIIMRKCLEYLKLQLMGRNYFDAHNIINIHQFRLQLWPGYITTIRQHEHDILMCSEIIHKIMHQETLLDVLKNCYKRNNHDYRREFCDIVIGLVVFTDYNINTYRIEDVDFDVDPSSTFPLKSGEVITYQDYYKNKYNIRITTVVQPMLVTRTKPKERSAGEGQLVYLVPELCRATGLNDKMREQFQVMKALAAHSCISPESRIEKLMSFNRRLRQESKVIQELKDWNMKLDQNLVEVPARVLSSEQLIFGGDIVLNSRQGDWTRDMQKARLLHSKELKNWIVIGAERDKHNVQSFINTLTRVSYGISFRIEQPRTYWLHDDKSSTYTENLEYILSKFTPDLIFCVVSNNRIDRYAAIKRKCCVDRPIPSQVLLQKNLQSRNSMTIATKVAVQMNCKLGGAPWYIQTSLKGLMAIGFDICHDTQTKGKHFVSMVATIDPKLTRYFSCIVPYHSDEELIDQVSTSVCKALRAYRVHNKALPMYIIIYRDGVSDGEVPHVYKHEVEHLKSKLEEAYYGPNFKMTFIIISKRINTRFFHNKRNPPTGTVVDDVVTSPFKYDFFIISQQVRQGTIMPTSYSIISDNSNLNAETIQQITYKLTHIYYNCSNTVRVPAPCHYAQKLSFLVGRFLHRPPDSQLENLLYFL